MSSEASTIIRQRDEAGILAALEHHGEVVDRCLHVAGAGRLDPRRDRVVVRVAVPIVEQRPLAGGVLDVLGGDRLTAGGLHGQLDDAEGAPRHRRLLAKRSLDTTSGSSSTPSSPPRPRDV